MDPLVFRGLKRFVALIAFIIFVFFELYVYAAMVFVLWLIAELYLYRKFSDYYKKHAGKKGD